MSIRQPICNIVTPIGMFGYGFDEQELHDALDKFSRESSPAGPAESVPTAIILDSGSTDSGPRKLANGHITVPRASYVRDFRKMLRCAQKFRVPILISSAGGDGSDEHVKVIEGVVEEVVKETSSPLKVLSISSSIPKSLILSRLNSSSISSCGASVPPLTQDDISSATRIVAQMGPEPYLLAMKSHPDFDVILGGRTNDPAPYVAFALAAFRKARPDFDAEENKGFAELVAGAIQHMGKTMECGGICAEPKSAGAMATIFGDGSFEIAPTDPGSRCTGVSVAAHTLYENGRPDVIAGPGGWLDLNESVYEQLEDGRTVRVKGGVYKRSRENGLPYQVKLEGAKTRGYRYMYMGAMKDPILISQLDDLLRRVKGYVLVQVEGLKNGEWELDFHVYGRDTSEVFLVGEALAETSELAKSIISCARTATIHGNYPSQKATGGNFAFGHGGMAEIDCGSCPQFCVYHLMNLEDGEEVSLFPITAQTFSGGSNGPTIRAASRETGSSRPAAPKGAFSSASQGSSSEALLKDATILSDVAKVLRSKNAGPYEITLDVMFDRAEVFEVMNDSGLLSAGLIARLYGLNEAEVLYCGWYKQALAFKATIPRKRAGLSISNGGFMESDMHGAQMHVPLFSLTLPDGLRKRLAALDPAEQA